MHDVPNFASENNFEILRFLPEKTTYFEKKQSDEEKRQEMIQILFT